MSFVTYFAAFIFVLALIAGSAWILRNFVQSGGNVPKFFNSKDKRIGVVESASMDGRRKLVLVRRDDKEHLVMIGGPVDMVIETGIGEQKPGSTITRSLERDNKVMVARGSERQTAAQKEDN